MKKLVYAIPAGALLSVGLAVSVAPSAAAASNCPSSGGLACYYDGANYSSTRGVIIDADFSGTCYLSGDQFYFLTASSLYNNSINTQTWYTGSNFTGSTITVARQSGRATLSSPFNNNIRSWKGTCYGGVSPAEKQSQVVPKAAP